MKSNIVYILLVLLTSVPLLLSCEQKAVTPTVEDKECRCYPSYIDCKPECPLG